MYHLIFFPPESLLTSPTVIFSKWSYFLAYQRIFVSLLIFSIWVSSGLYNELSSFDVGRRSLRILDSGYDLSNLWSLRINVIMNLPWFVMSDERWHSALRVFLYTKIARPIPAEYVVWPSSQSLVADTCYNRVAFDIFRESKKFAAVYDDFEALFERRNN